jgi:hypothetical protein
MSENLLELQNYPIAKGMGFVALWTMAIFAFFCCSAFARNIGF